MLQVLVEVSADIFQVDKSTVGAWDDARSRLLVRAARGFDAGTITLLS